MKAILAKKVSMSSTFLPNGKLVPVTILSAEPNTVARLKTKTSDGYSAVGLSLGARTRAEFRGEMTAKIGETLTVAQFAPGEKVTLVGTSKGKGFAGVVKRHGFHGAPKTHGTKDQLRMPGSIASKRQGAVAKGKRMAGRMGAARVTIQGLEVLESNLEKNTLVVKGSVPGARGSLVLVSEYKGHWSPR